MSPLNHPFVVIGSCFLWLTSIFSIVWSLLLFYAVGDMLVITGTDLINAMVLLSGLIMMPTNVFILFSVANGKKIDHKSKVICCPLWLCVIWIIAINCVGAALCIHKMLTCKIALQNRINSTMTYYRIVPKYKHFVDNLQWSLKCCGLDSYRDWFKNNWFDNIRDYEWNPPPKNHHSREYREVKTVTDSVPFSCCKSGTCISNYLLELGTSSIHTRGCGDTTYHILIFSLILHLVLFITIIVVEAMILRFIVACTFAKEEGCDQQVYMTHNIRHIKAVNDNFSASSASFQINPDDYDDDEFERPERRVATSKSLIHSQHSRMGYK